MKMAVFWVVAPCSLVEVYQRFRGPCCLHHRPDDGDSKDLWNVGKLLPDYTVHMKTAIFILTAVRTSNPTKNITFTIIFRKMLRFILTQYGSTFWAICTSLTFSLTVYINKINRSELGVILNNRTSFWIYIFNFMIRMKHKLTYLY
jgi:hypothetical protein